MKTTKILLTALFLTLALALCAIAAPSIADVADSVAEVAANVEQASMLAEVVESGTCGENLTWTLDDEGTLTISGIGGMAYWYYPDVVPWYSSRSSIKKVVIENGVTSIGESAFYHCDSLTSVDIPDSVTSIGGYAFSYCDSLTSIEIPDSVTSIGDSAFFYCYSLASVEIPDSVTSIGDYAFYSCDSLESINIPDNVTTIGVQAFYDCESLTSAIIGDSVTSIGSYAFYNCPDLTIYGYADSYVERYAFNNSIPFVSITTEFDVIYNANGGESAPENQKKTEGVNLTLSTSQPTKVGCVFLGWSTTVDGEVEYLAGGTYSEDKSVTLYAVWKTATVSVTGVSLNKTTLTLNIGDSETLTATITPDNATDKSVTWTSSNTDVATVENGTVTAVGAGSATITAKTADGAKKATCLVTVVDPDAPCEVFIYTESSKKTAVLGSEFTFTLSLSGTYDGYSVDIPKNFASGLTVTGVDAADSSDITDFDDKYMVSVLGGKGRVDSEKTTVATVTVKVDDAATLGDVLLLPSNIKISSELGDAVTAVGYNYATVNITDRIPGDINDDGKFDYYDVSKLYALYRNKTTVADYIDTDINGSGGFDYYDVSKLYAIYRGKATFN